MDNAIQPNRYNFQKPYPRNQKYPKILIVSDIIFMLSALTLATIWNAPIGKSLGAYFIILLFAGISGVATIISALYTFFKTIKKKDSSLHSFNIFSRYIILSFIVSAILLFVANNVTRYVDYLDSGTINVLSILSFLLLNITGFIHLAILTNNFKNHH